MMFDESMVLGAFDDVVFSMGLGKASLKSLTSCWVYYSFISHLMVVFVLSNTFSFYSSI